MRVFFENWAEIEAFLERLDLVRCPACGVSGAMGRHGFIRGWLSPRVHGIRARRLRCRPDRGGCGKAPSVRPGNILPRRCFSADALWAFIRQLLQVRSLKAAWERAGIRLSLDTGYRLHKRLALCQSALRTRLCSRAPPPAEGNGAGSPLLQMFHHLQTAFGETCAVSAYQKALQRDFLALA